MTLIKTTDDIKDMARGAVFLGTGGGGDPYVGELFLLQQLDDGRVPQIVQPDDVADDAFVVSIAGVGAPTVLVEQLVSERALLYLLERAQDFYGRKIDALISAEIGGANSMFPLALGARANLPVIDGDGMGRAFPHLEMTTFSIDGIPCTPSVMIDDLGNEVTVNVPNDRLAEDVVRGICNSLGAMTIGSFYAMTGAQMKQSTVRHTITETLEIGRCIRESRETLEDPFEGLMAYLNDPNRGRYAKIIFDGKITDVNHETRDGWHFGAVHIQSLTDPNDTMIVDIQNEYLAARRNGKTVTIVPDLISILDRETAEPLTAEMLHYGLRVKVIGYSAVPQLRTPKALTVCSPRQFGIEEDFVPVEKIA